MIPDAMLGPSNSGFPGHVPAHSYNLPATLFPIGMEPSLVYSPITFIHYYAYPINTINSLWLKSTLHCRNASHFPFLFIACLAGHRTSLGMTTRPG